MNIFKEYDLQKNFQQDRVGHERMFRDLCKNIEGNKYIWRGKLTTTSF